MYIIFLTSSLWILYFGLELQWMLLSIFFIIGSSVFRGLLNYLIINGILSIWLNIGIWMSHSLFFIIGCFGKVGYFPFFLVFAYLLYVASYPFSIFDILNKWAYFSSFLIILNISIFQGLDYWLIIINFFIIIFFIKFIISIKHLILISSYLLFLILIILIFIKEELFYSFILIFYIFINIIILLYTFYLSFTIRYAAFYFKSTTQHMDLNQFKRSMLFLFDPCNLKVYISISILTFYNLFLITFSFLPFILFFIKFFLLIFLFNQSISLVLLSIVFIAFIYHTFLSTSICHQRFVIMLI